MKKGKIELHFIYNEMVKRKFENITYFEILADIVEEFEIDPIELGLAIKKNTQFMYLLEKDGKQWNILINSKTKKKSFDLKRLFA